MSITLQIDDSLTTLVDANRIKQAALETIRYVLNDSVSAKSAVISITDNDTIQALNTRYRGINLPTDVLSFENISDPDFPLPEAEVENYLGDIVIAYPVAAQQAQTAGHSVMDELMLLTVHGILHLLGFDHDTSTHKARMWHIQAQILARLKLAHIRPTEE